MHIYDLEELPQRAERLEREASVILSVNGIVSYKDGVRATAKLEMAKDLRATYDLAHGRGFGGFQPPVAVPFR
jgi:hypothetical protein